MNDLMKKLRMLVKDEEGAAAVEYGILVAGIILVSYMVSPLVARAE